MSESVSEAGLETPHLVDTTVKVVSSDEVPPLQIQDNPPPPPPPAPPVLISKAIPPQVTQSVALTKIQDVRVDNWGNYCLQRLQAMYERSEYCDLTLQFQNLQIIKVHRVVVNMCTEYFANLERFFGLINKMLVLPKDIEFSSMIVIIKFFYTGKLEVRGAQFEDIYRTVKLMNINILVKLLEAHGRNPEDNSAKSKPTGQLMLRSTTPQVLKTLVHSGLTATAYPSGIRKKLTVSRPLPPGVKTKTVLARVQQQTIRVAGLPNRTGLKTSTLTPKKLPIWKERKSLIQPSDMLRRNPAPLKVEPARPTRFEWPDPEEEGSQRLMEDFKEEQEQPAIPTSTIRTRAADPSKVFDVVKNQVQTPVKHKLPADDFAELEGYKSKMAKLSDDIERELAAMEADHNDELNYEATTGVDAEMDNVMCQEISETTEVESAVEVRTTEPDMEIPNDNLTPNTKTTIIVSTETKPTLAKKVIKSVRFAPDLEKENKETEKEHQPVLQSLPSPSPASSQVEAAPFPDPVTQKMEPPNHSKLISEILKKYPELVKDNKSVKLKIVQKGPPDSGSKEGKSTVSYIVLKSSSSDTAGSVLLKKSSTSPIKSKFWDNENTVKKISSAAENTTGPWLCTVCGNPDNPEHFASYYLFRKHMVEVHDERVDARICEYCGYKASKRNLLLHHLYAKHSIEPPGNYSFPHCDRCDYVALSESLLSKHKLAHNSAKEFFCNVCPASFKSVSALENHMAANLHRNRDIKGQSCPHCLKKFARPANLRTHIQSLHKDATQMEEIEESFIIPDEMSSSHENKEPQLHSTELGQMVEVDGLISTDHHGDVIQIGQIGGSITVPLTLIPSSEAEALNNVASSIAASLGLGSQVHHTGDGYSEHIVGEGQQFVVLDNSSSQVELGGVEISGDGTMILGSVDQGNHEEGDFLIQDIHGNKFRKITARDADGNPVVFFQLTDETGQVPMTSMMDESTEMAEEIPATTSDLVEYEYDGNSSLSDHMYLDPQKCSIYVSPETGMAVPVTLGSEEVEQGQTLVTYSGDGEGSHVIELLPLNSVDSMEMHNNTSDEGQNHASLDPTEVEIVSEHCAEEETDELGFSSTSGEAQEVHLEEGHAYKENEELEQHHQQEHDEKISYIENEEQQQEQYHQELEEDALEEVEHVEEEEETQRVTESLDNGEYESPSSSEASTQKL